MAMTPDDRGDSRLQVLIVDDDAEAASAMGELVRLLGHEPLVANDGARALELAQATPVDVALLDIEMPGMDGHEVARRLVLLRRQAIYIVAITGRDSEADMVRSVTAGFIEHVVKPCTMKHLSKVFRRASDSLQRRRRPIESPQ
jgi:CheY-like chemotaxis protein